VDEKLHTDIDEPILMMTSVTTIAKPTASTTNNKAVSEYTSITIHQYTSG
jgi:hypothetical protein